MNIITKNIIFITTLLFSLISFALEPMDGYYSNDLLGAVDEAKERPHHYDYSNTYRYKRTTAQSIHLNPIDLNDLDETHLSMAEKKIDNNINENDRLAPESISVDSDIFRSINNSDQNINLPTNSLPQNTGKSVSLMGELSSSGIQNNTTLHSTPRP